MKGLVVSKHSKRTHKRGKKQAKKGGMSDSAKKKLAIGTGSVAVLVLGVWAWFAFTTIAPPKLDTADSQQVAAFLGNKRGFKRMPVDRREAFLNSAYQRFSRGQDRGDFTRSLRQMSSSEKRVFVNAGFDIASKKFMKQAREYNKTPANKRAQALDKIIRNFEGMRRELGGGDRRYAGGAGGGGGGGGGVAPGGGRMIDGGSVADPFKGAIPTKSDELMKVLINKTSPKERAEARPLIDDLAERYKELKDPRERKRFDANR